MRSVHALPDGSGCGWCGKYESLVEVQKVLQLEATWEECSALLRERRGAFSSRNPQNVILAQQT
jgi:hypothetical protein